MREGKKEQPKLKRISCVEKFKEKATQTLRLPGSEGTSRFSPRLLFSWQPVFPCYSPQLFSPASRCVCKCASVQGKVLLPTLGFSSSTSILCLSCQLISPQPLYTAGLPVPGDTKEMVIFKNYYCCCFCDYYYCVAAYAAEPGNPRVLPARRSCSFRGGHHSGGWGELGLF